MGQATLKLRSAALRSAALLIIVVLGAADARATLDCTTPPPDPPEDLCPCPCSVMTDPPSGLKKVVCQLDDNDEAESEVSDAPAYGVAVYEETGELCGEVYCIWGQKTTGGEFMCAFGTQDDELVSVELWGGDNDDKLYFSYSSTNPTWNLELEPWEDYDPTPNFLGRQYGLDGEDWLHGSNYSGSKYVDILDGQGDADLICAAGGNDIVLSGNGDDVVCLGDGDDVAFLGHGNDECDAGDGDDIVRGEAHLDFILDPYGDKDIDGGTEWDECEGWTSLSPPGVVNCEVAPASSMSYTCP